jgi:predicted transcriptional regulator
MFLGYNIDRVALKSVTYIHFWVDFTKIYKGKQEIRHPSMCMIVQYAKLRRRNQLNIIADILMIAKNGARKTQIMYRANLSYTQLNLYIQSLINNNLLAQTMYDGKGLYIVTPKGNEFLQMHKELTKLIENNQLIIA